MEPKKSLSMPEHIEKFKTSQIFNDYMYFISGLQQSVKSKPFSATPKNEKFNPLVNYLTKLEDLVTETPPLE